MDEEDDFDKEELRDRLNALAHDRRSSNNNSLKRSSTQFNSNNATTKRQKTNPFELEYSPIGNDIAEMEQIPSRKSRGR